MPRHDSDEGVDRVKRARSTSIHAVPADAEGGEPAGRALIERLVSTLVLDEIDTMNAPHIVLICDPYVAELTAYGPFTDALAAATVAEQLRDQLLDDEHRCMVDAVVIPLRAFVHGAG